MILEPRFTDDVADLPTHKFGPSSLTWWGIIGFMVIEGGFFALAFAAYFFLMGHEQGWPPEGRRPARPPRRHVVHDRHPRQRNHQYEDQEGRQCRRRRRRSAA